MAENPELPESTEATGKPENEPEDIWDRGAKDDLKAPLKRETFKNRGRSIEMGDLWQLLVVGLVVFAIFAAIVLAKRSIFETHEHPPKDSPTMR